MTLTVLIYKQYANEFEVDSACFSSDTKVITEVKHLDSDQDCDVLLVGRPSQAMYRYLESYNDDIQSPNGTRSNSRRDITILSYFPDTPYKHYASYFF